jgi:hypothetical protein
MELVKQEHAAVAAVQTHALAVSSPAGIMLTAMERGISPGDLRELMNMQREWQADQARAAFNAALAAFKFEPIVVRKAKLVGYTTKQGEEVGYRHAELSDVVDAVGPALSKHGLSFRWDVKQTPTWISVTCILKHALGHSETCELGGPPDASGKKNAIQQIASTVTYLQRYTLKAITGVAEGGQDDDGQGGDDGEGLDPAQGQGVDPQRAKGEPATGAKPELPPYPPESFEKNLPAWRQAIAAGKKSAAEVIATVQAKGLLTPEQKAAIRAA